MPFDMYFQLVTVEQLNDGTNKFMTFGQKRSLGVRGLQKLMNMFAKYLLTPLGSNPIDPNDGTILTSLLGSNVSPADAEDILIMCVDKTVKAIQAAQQGTATPTDERLAAATITGYVEIPTGPGFSAQILIQNTAGQTATFLLPSLGVQS
jgi:hypothetical protein